MDKLDELKYDIIEAVLRVDMDEESIDILDEVNESVFELYVYIGSRVLNVGEEEFRLMSKLVELID